MGKEKAESEYILIRKKAEYKLNNLSTDDS